MGVAKVPTKQLGTPTSFPLAGVPCDSSVYVGAVVRMSAGVFVNAQADIKANGHVFGICSAKSSSTVCDILLPGSISDSIFLGLDTSKEYFLSDTVAGSIITAPLSLATGKTVWFIGKPYTATRLLFLPCLRWIN